VATQVCLAAEQVCSAADIFQMGENALRGFVGFTAENVVTFDAEAVERRAFSLSS